MQTVVVVNKTDDAQSLTVRHGDRKLPARTTGTINEDFWQRGTFELLLIKPSQPEAGNEP